MEARAAEIGLPWPYHEPKRAPGRISRRIHWLRFLAAWVRETKGDTAWPESTTCDVPDWWRPGAGIVRDVEKEFHDTFVKNMKPLTEQEEMAKVRQVEAEAEGLTPLLRSQKSTDSCESLAAASTASSSQDVDADLDQADTPSGKRRKKIHVAQEAKDFMLGYIERMGKRSGWDTARCVKHLQALCPELYGHIHVDAPRKWKRFGGFADQSREKRYPREQPCASWRWCMKSFPNLSSVPWRFRPSSMTS